MIKASWISFLTIGLLWSAANFADDVQPSKSNDELLPVVSLSLEAMLAESKLPSRWRLLYPAGATVYSDDWPQLLADFDFQEAGAWSRVSELRGLSLLTLAEFGQTSLFLGVNKEGLAGLHFDVCPRYSDKRYLELVRMPYLRKTSQAAE
jgi:hypothetical protein